MENLKVGELNIELRPNGQLNNVHEWSIDVARALAKRENLTLTDAHWEIIQVMRDYYARYNISPIRKLLKKEIAEKIGATKADDSYLINLFPNDVLVQGMRIAGLPKPMLDAEIEQSSAIQKIDPQTPKTHFTDEFGFKGKIYQVYANGNLVHLEQWSEELAEFLAAKERLKLTADHWEIIHYLRNFYFKYGITPMVKLLMKHMREQLGKHKSSQAYLYDLFPGGPARQGSRIAGLPAPQGCLDP